MNISGNTAILTVNPNSYVVTNDPRNTFSAIWKDFGAGYFAGDWTFRTSVKAVATSSNSNRQCFFGLSDAIGDWFTLTAGAGTAQGIAIEHNGVNWILRLSNGAGSVTLAIDTNERWVQIRRVGTDLYADVYTDSNYSVLQSTMHAAAVVTTAWEYCFGWDAWGVAPAQGLQSINVGELIQINGGVYSNPPLRVLANLR